MESLTKPDELEIALKKLAEIRKQCLLKDQRKASLRLETYQLSEKHKMMKKQLEQLNQELTYKGAGGGGVSQVKPKTNNIIKP